jgi:hypothetical protein
MPTEVRDTVPFISFSQCGFLKSTPPEEAPDECEQQDKPADEIRFPPSLVFFLKEANFRMDPPESLIHRSSHTGDDKCRERERLTRLCFVLAHQPARMDDHLHQPWMRCFWRASRPPSTIRRRILGKGMTW